MGNDTSNLANFEYLRTNKCRYVDKTEYIFNLVDSHDRLVSLYRPPRFGKTLTISTLKALFEGKKELFEGLAIYDQYEWSQTYPVIHLDFEDCKAKTSQALEKYLRRKLAEVAHLHNLKLRTTLFGMDFEMLIDDLHEKAPVVVLIDNFEKPVMSNLDSPDYEEIVKTMVGFYGILKGCTSQLRFCLLTGAIEFCLVTYFSGLNNQLDISMDSDVGMMLGFTQAELEKYFQDEIEATYPQLKLTRAEFLEKFKRWYGGFRFSIHATETVYNPFSVIRFFEQKHGFQNYWSAEASPLGMIQLAKQKNYDLISALSYDMHTEDFTYLDFENFDPLSLLHQSGYFTIKHSKLSDFRYCSWLGFPNIEAGESFNQCFRTCFLPDLQAGINLSIESFRKALKARNWNALMEEMKLFFAQYYSCINSKYFWENRFQVIFLCFCFTYGIHPEDWIEYDDCPIYATIQLDGRTFIFEFKHDSDLTARSNLQNKPYYQKYLASSNEITLVEISFNPETTSLNQIEVEDIDKCHPHSTNRRKS